MKITNINKQLIKNLLNEGKRIDNRDPLEYRDLEIENNVSINAEGSVRVRLGKTEVVVGVKMGVQEPYPDHEDEGTMMTSMEFSPICGKRYEQGPPKMDAIETARVIDRGIRESKFIDWKKLCIKEGEKVWSIAVDIYCINDDGNALDAGAIGAVAALKLARFPEYNEEDGTINYGHFTDKKLPLTKNIPFTMTFHKIGDKILIDPNREEEDTSEARVTFAISQPEKEKIINAMQKGNEDSITAEELNEMVEMSEKVFDKMFPKVIEKIKSLE